MNRTKWVQVLKTDSAGLLPMHTVNCLPPCNLLREPHQTAPEGPDRRKIASNRTPLRQPAGPKGLCGSVLPPSARAGQRHSASRGALKHRHAQGRPLRPCDHRSDLMPKPWPGRAKLPQPAAGLSCFCCSRRRPMRVRKVSVAGLGCGRAGARTGPAACDRLRTAQSLARPGITTGGRGGCGRKDH